MIHGDAHRAVSPEPGVKKLAERLSKEKECDLTLKYCKMMALLVTGPKLLT